MRYIVDISPDKLDKINEYIQNGRYRTVQTFILTAIDNQIYLDEIPEPEQQIISKITNKNHITFQVKNEEKKKTSLSPLELRTITKRADSSSINRKNDKLSGFWNKILPVKISIRVLSNMFAEINEPILLDLLYETASLEARTFGRTLVRKEKGSGRKRGDRLFTGLPISRSSDKSRLRFNTHFIGNLTSGKIDGMSGTLGLINIYKGEDGRDYVEITKSGLEFSQIRNPIIDDEIYENVLSTEESEYLNKLIQNELPKEYEEMLTILQLVKNEASDTLTLKEKIMNSKTQLSENQITIFLSGILNRLVDLKLLKRRYDGLSYTYKLSDKGKKIISGESN